MKRPATVAYIQDMVHLAVKLKSRLLRPSIILPLGKYTAGGHHLRLLHNSFSKDHHGLREKDINHKDKQNYEAVLRMTSDSVMKLLIDVRIYMYFSPFSCGKLLTTLCTVSTSILAIKLHHV